MISPSATTTAPTVGLGEVGSGAVQARASARDMKSVAIVRQLSHGAAEKCEMRKKELVGGLTDELAPVGADLRAKHHTERSHEQNEGQGPDDLTHGIPFLA